MIAVAFYLHFTVCLCLRVYGMQVEGLVGKVDGVKTVIAASKRGLHGFPCHHVPAIMGLHHFHFLHSTLQCRVKLSKYLHTCKGSKLDKE